MAFDKNFKPVLRFLVVSDVHYADEHDYVSLAVEAAERMKKNLLRYITVL